MARSMELTDMQLYKVAEQFHPSDWTSLGIHLGFLYGQIQHWVVQYKKNIKHGIFNMLVTWLSMYPNFTKPDARKFLVDQLKAMKKYDLAYFLINTEVGFVPPHNILIDGSSRQFEYEVRTFQKEKELSFSVHMHSREGQVQLPLVLDCLTKADEFAEKLSICIHVLGLRLVRMGLQDDESGSSIKFTVAAIDEDCAHELRKRVKSSPNPFADDLNRVICRYVPFNSDTSTISLNTSFSKEAEEEICQIIQQFRDEASTSPSDAEPLRVNDLELVRLAQELDATRVTPLGLELGMTNAEISNLEDMTSRSQFEHMLFGWKSKHNPCKADLADLASILESVEENLLASRLRQGKLRETEREEQRRTYLQRASAPCSLKNAMKSLSLQEKRSDQFQTSQFPGYVNFSPPGAIGESESKQHTYVNLPKERTLLEADDKDDPDYESIIFKTSDGNALGSPKGDGKTEQDPHYERIRSDRGDSQASEDVHEDHIYMNDADVQLRGSGIQRDPVKRTSHKRFGSSTIPVVDNIDFSILDPMWDKLQVFGVTENDTSHIAGLVKLAIALDRGNEPDIADTIWTALIKEYLKNEYLRRFVTGSVVVVPRVITNRQDFQMGQRTALEEVVKRTKDLDYPSRIFIEASLSEDRDMVAEKLGHDWAMEKDPKNPLGNVDLLYVLKVADIVPGSTVGDALTSQRVCSDFKLSPTRLEDYMKNTMTEYIIVLKGDESDFKKLFSVATSDEQKFGFRELVNGKYLDNCIVIMTVGPQALLDGPKNYAHYKLDSATSDC